MRSFRFDLEQGVIIKVSGETGMVVARAEYINTDAQYLIRYRAADGRAVESWWMEDALLAQGM